MVWKPTFDVNVSYFALKWNELKPPLYLLMVTFITLNFNTFNFWDQIGLNLVPECFY